MVAGANGSHSHVILQSNVAKARQKNAATAFVLRRVLRGSSVRGRSSPKRSPATWGGHVGNRREKYTGGASCCFALDEYSCFEVYLLVGKLCKKKDCLLHNIDCPKVVL